MCGRSKDTTTQLCELQLILECVEGRLSFMPPSFLLALFYIYFFKYLFIFKIISLGFVGPEWTQSCFAADTSLGLLSGFQEILKTKCSTLEPLN